ncbi:hypothetical protein CR513_41403, partial [Mucuna pruriens]
MLDLGASINVMPTSIYKALNFGDLEPTGMTIQLANKSIVQPLGILEDVLVQVNELIFPVDFYVLDMEDETSRQGSTLILGRPFLMTARTKIDMHAGTLLMEFGDTLVQFNIFEAMKHHTEDHSLFGIDLIDELADYDESGEVHNLSNSEDNKNDIVDLDFEAELLEVLDQLCKHEKPEYSIDAKLATTFTVEDELAKGSRDQERTEVILSKKTTVKADDLHVQVHAETISAKEDQKQTKAESISDVQGKECIPSGSDFRTEQRVEYDFHLIRTKSRRRSRP